jgi:sulfopyruvate decarboxylase TPP-binding subunit
MTWADSFLRTLKENDVRLVTYVPDNVLTPLISGAAADNFFMSIGATREDEAVGTLAGAYMGGRRGVVMMQTSGFALIANALASLLAAKIDDKPGIGQTVRDPALIRNRFMRGLGTGSGTALDA